MDAVHIIITDDLLHTGYNVFPGFLTAGIVVDASAVFDHHITVAVQPVRSGIVAAQRPSAVAGIADAVGIDPCLHRKPLGMGLIDHDLKRVISRADPFGSGQGIGPGEQIRVIEGVAKGTHLNKNSVVAVICHIGKRLGDGGFKLRPGLLLDHR